MPGQAIIAIGSKQWIVSVAYTPTELAQGLRGLASIPAGTGMLFDLGQEQTITVTTVPMLFPLDILFLNSALVVNGLALNVAPGYLVTTDVAARYFLEVNAGEAAEVQKGQQASAQGLTTPSQFQIGDIIKPLGEIICMFFVALLLRSVFKAMFTQQSSSSGHHSSNPGNPAPQKLPPSSPQARQLLEPGKFPDRDKALHRLGEYEVVEVHDDGDLTVRSAGKLWVVTTEGELFVGTPSISPEISGAKVYFIGSCKVSEGLCLTHGYSVRETVRCPGSPLNEEEWKAAYDLVHEAFPEGQHNPWVDGWWPRSYEEAERTVRTYADSLRAAFDKYAQKTSYAVEKYRQSTEKAIRTYRQYVMKEYERGKSSVLALAQTTGKLIGSAE